MRHCGTQRLETQRLVLRRYVIDDAEAMFQNWASDEEVTKFLMWPAHESLQVSRDVTENKVKQYADKTVYNWAIVYKENGDEPIGDIAVVHMDEKTAAVHIGYCIGKKWWHRGITSEALAAVMDFLFDTVGANRIESRHDPRNPNAGKVMQKMRHALRGHPALCGLEQPGHL